MPFKKATDDGVQLAPNFVESPDFLLTEETKDLAPIDGWEWISQEEYDKLAEKENDERAEQEWDAFAEQELAEPDEPDIESVISSG